MRLKLRDSLVHVHGIALVIKSQNCTIVASEQPDGSRDTGEARVAVGILLGEDGDLVVFRCLTFTR